jgi:DNA-binding CsgD family transcriptional regulator
MDPDGPSVAGLVGRVPEQVAIARFIDSISAGAAALVLRGDAGVGKTTLWLHGRDLATRTGRVLSCRPAELGTKLSYSGLADLFDGLDRETSALTAAERHALLLATRREEIGDMRIDHATVALAAKGVLDEVSRSPLMLAIDDLQWLDPSSAKAIGFALRRLPDRPIGVLASQRGSASSELLRSGLPPDRVSVLELGPLSEEETDQLIRVRLGAALRRPLVGQIHRTAAGNPLFSLELARAALQQSTPLAAGTPLPLPSSLRELMGRRIAVMSAATRDVLLLVAACADATAATVERALGRGSLAALERGVDAGLLDIERGHLTFTHPLLAATAYAEADQARRRRIHVLLASISSDVEERARQLSAASVLPDAQVATDVEAGAGAAYARGAPEAAGTLAERALALTPEDCQADTFRRAVAAADYLWEAGDTARCVGLLRSQATQLPAGPRRAAVLRRLASAIASIDGWPAAITPLAQGIAEAGTDARLQAAIHRDLAFVVMQTGDVRASTKDAERALRFAGRTADREVRADTEAVYLLQAVVLGKAPDDLSNRLARLAALADTRDRWIPSGSRLVLVAVLLKWTDDFEAARSLLTAVYREHWGRQEDGLLIPALFQLGELECWAGNLDEAVALGHLAQETEQRSPRLAWRGMSIYPSALAAARAGECDRARELAHECLSIAERTGDGRHQMRALGVLGFVDLTTGDATAARAHLGRAEALRRELGYDHPGVVRTAADHIESLLNVGDHSAADQHLTVLTEQADRTASRWGAMAARRSRGLLDAATGDLYAAEDALRSAVAIVDSVQDPLERGRSLHALGGVLRRSRRRIEAREVLVRARAAFAAVGAQHWLAKVDAELDRLHGRGRQAPGLTPMETRISELVAAGRSNKEIAAEAYLSLKTVEAHLSSIYRKLGLRSRTELAAHLLSPSEPLNR